MREINVLATCSRVIASNELLLIIVAHDMRKPIESHRLNPQQGRDHLRLDDRKVIFRRKKT